MSDDHKLPTIKTFTFSQRRSRSSKQTQEPLSWETANSMDCHLHMEWIAIGRVILGNDGLEFPLVQHTPAVYRIRIRSSAGSEAVYFGETADLERRLNTHYRKPDPSQSQNVRLHKLFHEALSAGAEIAVAVVAPGAWIDFGGTRYCADFSSKPERVLVEHAAIVESQRQHPEIESLNL